MKLYIPNMTVEVAAAVEHIEFPSPLGFEEFYFVIIGGGRWTNGLEQRFDHNGRFFGAVVMTEHLCAGISPSYEDFVLVDEAEQALIKRLNDLGYSVFTKAVHESQHKLDQLEKQLFGVHQAER